MIALTDDMMVIIELKPRVDRYTVIQLKSYIRKREFFEILSGRKVEFWLVTPYISRERREEIEELGVKIIERQVLPF